MPNQFTKREQFTLDKPIAEQFPVVEDTTCVEVRIPNDLEYLYLLQGFMAQMTDYWVWSGTPEQRQARAAICLKAYVETEWGNCMNCEELTACILPLLEAQRDQILSGVSNLMEYGTEAPGESMTEERLEENLAQESNPSCNKNILWAQCLSIVQFTNRAISDLMEKLEIASNVAELSDIITDLPVVNLAVDQVGVESVEGMINYIMDSLREQYTAQYTEDVENRLACQLFCAASADCVLSVDLIYDEFYANVSDEIPDNPVDLAEWLNTLAGLNVNGDNVVDLMFWFGWAGAKLLSVIVSKVVADNASLNTLLQVAVSEADTDWQVLCEDCPITCLVEVQANNDPFVAPFGQNSYIPVLSGVTYHVEVTGNWMNGVLSVDADGESGITNPTALVPTANIASLVYKVGGDGEWLAGGVEFDITPTTNNNIYFAMNNVPGVYGGVSGELCVTAVTEV